MADRVEMPIVTVPAGTLAAAPQVTALPFSDAILERVEVIVPPGPCGLVGFAFVHSGQQVIPFTGGQWIVTDNEKVAWDLEHFPTGNKWSLRAYNTDVYPHSLYLRMLLRELPLPVPQPVAPILVVPTMNAMVESS